MKTRRRRYHRPVSRRTLSILVFAAGIGFSAACLYNVLGDNTAVVADAKKIACGDLGADCNVKTTYMSRTPFGQSFQMHTPKRSVAVTCRRAAIFVGPWSCEL